MTGGYTNSLSHFSNGSNLTNTTGNVLTGGGSYAVSPQTSLLSDYAFSKFSFSGGSATAGTSSTDTHVVNVGVKQQFAADLDVTARAGGTYLPAQDRLTPNFDMGVTKKFSASSAAVHFSRSVASSGGLAALVSTREVHSLLLTHQVTAALATTLSANYSTNKSVGIRTVDLTSYQLSPGLRYAFSRYVSLTASYVYLKSDSQGVTGTSLNRNQFIIGMTATWP